MKLVRKPAPIWPAFTLDCGETIVSQNGSSRCFGIGTSLTLVFSPLPDLNDNDSPRHNLRTTSIPSSIMRRRSSYESGAKTKSLGCQPEAKDIPTRPWDKLSTIAHSSATLTGLCNGITTLPARMLRRCVSLAIAAAKTEALGEKPPNESKWRSGIQMAEKP